MNSPPPSFSWVEKDVLAACGCPTKPDHFEFFDKVGIRHITSLKLQSSQDARENCDRLNLKLSNIGIIDFQPPTQDQIQQFLTIVEEGKANNQPVVVHCALGRGRTGTMLACYLAKHKNLTAQQALNEIRKMRPGSVETGEQERAIQEFVNNCNN